MAAPRPFAEYLREAAAAARIPPREIRDGECTTPSGTRCHLCLASRVTYEQEIPIKADALTRFLGEVLPALQPEPLRSTGSGRAYRSVSKRKIQQTRRGIAFGLIDPEENQAGGLIDVRRCAIEPPSHARIYDAVQALLQDPRSLPLAQVLRYAIVKGREEAVILNVSELDGSIAKASTRLSKGLTERCPEVTAIYLLEDTSDGRYYLGARGRGRMHRVFGRRSMFVRVLGKPFLFPPAGFTQINHGALDDFVRTAGDMLRLDRVRTLWDLYCGFGLFALSFAPAVKRAIGLEIDDDAVRAARENATRHGASNTRFLRAPVTASVIAKSITGVAPEDAVLLDPPRGGTAPGVIEAITRTAPGRILHIFCNIDIMPDELRRWGEGGYRVERLVPIDMFPGTSTVEVLVSLLPAEQKTAGVRRGRGQAGTGR